MTVTGPGGTSGTSPSDQFTYDPVPTVTAVSPAKSSVNGTITITGTGFVSGASVQFGSTSSSALTVVSPTQITAVAPVGTGTVDTVVTTPGGPSATSSDKFTYGFDPPIGVGTNGNGQLGNGTTTAASSPIMGVGPDNFIQIAAGTDFSIGIGLGIGAAAVGTVACVIAEPCGVAEGIAALGISGEEAGGLALAGTATAAAVEEDPEAFGGLTGAAAEAASTQGDELYTGVDAWENTVLRAGQTVWAGEPGLGYFATSGEVADAVGNDATALNEGLQIASENGSYRQGLTALQLTQNVEAAQSTAIANPQFGSGGLFQYYIPNLASVTTPLVTRLMR